MAEKNTVPFKTVKEYREYMNGSPDDDRTLRHNPPPTDGMTLSEPGQKSDEEILAIINEMGECEKKSDIRVMYCSGYAFSWTDLTVVANFRGFNKTSGKRKVQYSLLWLLYHDYIQKSIFYSKYHSILHFYYVCGLPCCSF